MTLPTPKTLEEALLVIAQLVQYINELEARLSKNSHNSSKPPSSDGLSKPPRTQSLREPSSRPPGGQTGHPGKHLSLVDNPDEVIRHSVSHCQHCGRSLKDVAGEMERRQVRDIPPFNVRITEHQIEVKGCPDCNHQSRAALPAGVSGVTSYGPRLQSLALYFMHYQFIPYERCREMFLDLFSMPLSVGTLWEINQRADKNVAPTYQKICQQISQAEVAHFDETGINVGKKLHWLHVVSTKQLT
ncbi:MAG: transposase, partial [Candidatus Margulisbacteria bacterium]|nr:transposase [Candidatus Margulisiibacteriota bacterium]